MNRIKASLMHFLVSVFVVGLALTVVFLIWYPPPYGESNDIWSIVKILICVDLVLGPLITLIIFNTKKSRRELQRDLSVVATVQMMALCYGMYSMYVQRPNYLVFGVDRFETLPDNQVDKSPLHKKITRNPIIGPLVVYAHSGDSDEEKKKLILDWMQGKGDFTTRRERYRPVLEHINEIKQAAVDIQSLNAIPANSSKADEIEKLHTYASDNAKEKIFLPLAGKSRIMITAFDTTTGKIGPAFNLIPWTHKEKVGDHQTTDDAAPIALETEVED